ncbi:hypothetical protein MLD38_031857 [Melastoma candidum]|uniref:Uncharacterized protein n=1 Tax=Melastoma candidum TaxID=119954 RepID=A0ACB9MS44_9MYRT|nr:hypothetical protein MLD38_031857 [Melastoma candidum]
MARAGSPCGACKFLRRRCVRGCVFAPYFCHEQGAAHFAAIHKVFGASNVSKALGQPSCRRTMRGGGHDLLRGSGSATRPDLRMRVPYLRPAAAGSATISLRK